MVIEQKHISIAPNQLKAVQKKVGNLLSIMQEGINFTLRSWPWWAVVPVKAEGPYSLFTLQAVVSIGGFFLLHVPWTNLKSCRKFPAPSWLLDPSQCISLELSLLWKVGHGHYMDNVHWQLLNRHFQMICKSYCCWRFLDFFFVEFILPEVMWDVWEW